MCKSISPGVTRSYVLFILIMCFSAVSVAKPSTAQPAPGEYCPGTNILRIVAEDLSTSLIFIMQSRAAQARNNQTEMMSQLSAAGVVLSQATSRGAGARTALLINSIMLSRVNESNDQLLTWFPMLHSALLTLPESEAESAAEDAVGQAEEILQDGLRGNAIDSLKKARHFLTCDDLNLPLQAAIKEQTRLLSRIQQHKPVVTKDYDKLINSLREALTYVLNRTQM